MVARKLLNLARFSPCVQTDIFTLSVPPQPTAALLADLRAKAVGAGIASDAAAAAEMTNDEILKRLGEVRQRSVNVYF